MEIIGALFLYITPGIIASCRKHKNGLAVWMVNVLLGWTLIGWIVSLIWACTYQERRTA